MGEIEPSTTPDEPRRVLIGHISPEAPATWKGTAKGRENPPSIVITLPYVDGSFHFVLAVDGKLVENHQSLSESATGKMLRVLADQLDPPPPPPRPARRGFFSRLFG